MDNNAASSARSSPGPSGLPDLRTEVVGTLLLFSLTATVTAGVALCAHLMARAFG